MSLGLYVVSGEWLKNLNYRIMLKEMKLCYCPFSLTVLWKVGAGSPADLIRMQILTVGRVGPLSAFVISPQVTGWAKGRSRDLLRN